MQRLWLVSFLVVGCAPQEGAQSPPSPPPQKTVAFEGEGCAPGGATPRCSPGLRCIEQPHEKLPPREPGKVHSPEEASDVGGACGGVAGYHCAEGLECAMPPDQIMVADGMGTCAVRGVCAR